MSEPVDETMMTDLMSAWDEMEGAAPTEEPAAEADAPEGEEPEEETVVAEGEATEDAGEEETTEEEAEDEGDEETEEAEGDSEPEPVSFATTDPAVLAYLARYDNNPEKALRAAVELNRVLTRQGREKNEALARVSELEGELEQARMFDGGPAWLNEEQREYVNGAIGSENPLPWVQQAVKAGEFELARAIVDQWAEDAPFPAMRASQTIDRAEAATQAQPEGEPADGFDHSQLLGLLVDSFPEMPRYEPQMVLALQNLGEQHPLVVGARSQDPNEAARAIISLYEIARASSATVKTTRDQIKRKSKQDAATARDAAVVTSGSATPSAGETPRKTMIAPGLSLEELDREFAQHSQ